MQIIDLYDINYKTKIKEKIGEFSFPNNINSINTLYEAIEEKILSYIEPYEKIRQEMELDKIYYLIQKEPWEIIGVIALHKGYTYIDCAEHDDRVIIKTVFPNKKCNIIDEG